MDNDPTTKAQQQSSGLVRATPNSGMGATVSFPFIDNPLSPPPGGGGSSGPLDSLTSWLDMIGQYVQENPLLALGAGIGLILMVSSSMNKGRGRG